LAKGTGGNAAGRPGREEHVSFDVEARRVGFFGVQLEAVPVKGEGGIDEVDRLALPVDDLAGDTRDRAVGFERLDGGPDPARMGSGVVAQEGEVPAGGGFGAAVA